MSIINNQIYIKTDKIKIIAACLVSLFAISFFAGGFSVHAVSTSSKQLVRVGFPILDGSSYIDEHGNYAGYLVDYLDQLEPFVNWDIQFVCADGDIDTQFATLMEKLRNGEIDMMGTMERNEELENMFLYPSTSYGMSHTVLAVTNDNIKWMEDDFDHWNGIRVAVYPDMPIDMEEFKYYAYVNNFSYTVVECKDKNDVVRALNDGSADAILGTDITIDEDYRIIGRFLPKPYYFAVSPNNPELLRQIDTAVQSLISSKPDLQNQLYSRHFQIANEFSLPQTYRDYIQSLGTVNILFFKGNAPYQYIKDGVLKGMAVELIDDFAKMTGMKYRPVVASTYEEAYDMIKRGEIDVVAMLSTSTSISNLPGVRFTSPYLNSTAVSVYSYQTPPEQDLPGQFRMNIEKVFNDMKNTDSGYVQIDYYAMNFYMRKSVVYNYIKIDRSVNQSISYACGVTSNISDEFISIMNMYINSLTSEYKSGLFYKYSADDVEYTFWEWVITNRLIVLVSIIIIAMVIICLIMLRNRIIKNKALQAENRLLHLATYDELTGAYNEGYFRKLVENLCISKEPMALVAFNIRNFKYINDVYGLKHGNEILRGVTSIIETHINDGEFFCRASVDLFMLKLDDSTPDKLTERLEKLLGDICVMADKMLEGYSMHFYCGAVFVADSPKPFDFPLNMSYLMAMLNHSRKMNIQPVCILNEYSYDAEELKYYVESHMQSALDRGEFKLYLQPKINLHTNRIDGAEALVRWQTNERGMLYPNQFIPIFEENGFCAHLDLYMIETACKTLRKWIDSGTEPITISVNQTKSIFVKEDYVERLIRITKKYNIEPKYIILEILEGLAFDNIDDLNITIKKLNDIGFMVSMDDFGSGYSSLNTLGKLNINELKLDRAFLTNVMDDDTGRQREILASIMALAKRIGVRTVVEGVETEENEKLIRSMECDFGQGYLYSKPIPANDFRTKFL